MPRTVRRRLLLALFAACAAAAASPLSAQVKPKFDSRLVTSDTPGHAVAVDVDITGAKELFLVVADGGNGFACDWADWAEPRLEGPKGTLKLTELKWQSASTGWGQVRINQNCEGGPLRIAGKPVEYGIGTHANSLIAFKLPAGYTRFKARAGLDEGGTSQNGGRSTSVQFLVFTEKPPVALAGNSGPTVRDSGQREPRFAVANLDVYEGLQAQLFAAEPLLLSPADVDVDHLGRVWVCEVVNYRGRNGQRAEGDRILVLEDTDGDGAADKQTVFYQGRDVDSALGICVLGNRVIVSVAPNVFIFTDEDGDLKADTKEVFFSKVGQPQHDHSTHAFVFGPDGRLYWNVGNTGQHVHDKEGKLIVDLAGNQVIANGKPYRQGMVFRCEPDGSDFEVLGHNFRNNYEVAVDSFGTLWQSDNDDDGNRGVRINYVMEYGNFGYTDERTGAGWRTPRTNLETEVPRQHWHQNDPGVIPNLLHTGAGSPTGILVYEGNLLPEVFRGQVIHCDAGPNVVRAYPVTKDGAGYTAEIVNILHGARDQWFRPSDVCTAPDGSLIVADWYDPGVGGHAMGDIDRGRIFRVAPPDTPYKMPKFDLTTPEGALAALKNPNLSARYLGFSALRGMGAKAEKLLAATFAGDPDPRHRARALWLLGQLPGRGDHYVRQALADKNEDLRIAGLRLARRLKLDIDPYVRDVVNDPSPQVRRDAAIALRFVDSPEAVSLWVELALQHDGRDRWYLEALGLGAERKWNACFEAWLAKVGSRWNEPAGRDLVWRSRADQTSTYLARLIADPQTPSEELPRLFRALDFQSGPARDDALLELAFGKPAADPQRAALISLEATRRIGGFDIRSKPQYAAALDRALEAARGTEQFVALVEKFNVTSRYPELLALAQEHPADQLGIAAVRALLARQSQLLAEALQAPPENPRAQATLEVLGNSADGRAADVLLTVVQDSKQDLERRRQATRALARLRNGAQTLVQLAREKKLDPGLETAAAFQLNTAPWDDIRRAAAELFPPPPSKNNQPLPPITELLKMKGDVARGQLVFEKSGTCANCHVVRKQGKEVGPNLTEIGSKLSRQAMFESILYPSAGISHNFETYALELSSGNVVTGVLVSRTPDSVTIRGADAITRTFKNDEIEQIAQQKQSLMPADLQKNMTAQDLVDLVDYLMTLRKTAE